MFAECSLDYLNNSEVHFPSGNAGSQDLLTAHKEKERTKNFPLEQSLS